MLVQDLHLVCFKTGALARVFRVLARLPCRLQTLTLEHCQVYDSSERQRFLQRHGAGLKVLGPSKLASGCTGNTAVRQWSSCTGLMLLCWPTLFRLPTSVACLSLT